MSDAPLYTWKIHMKTEGGSKPWFSSNEDKPSLIWGLF